MTGQPWLKFYPADWQSDASVRVCSLAARGLWIEMLCLMHASEPRGSLLLNGRQVTARQLAPMVGTSVREVDTLLGELEEAGVFSRDEDGTIFSRRIRKDIVKAERDRLNGRNGGNPLITKRVNPPDNGGGNGGQNGGDKGPDKAHGRASAIATQRPEARSQSPESDIAAAAEPEPQAAAPQPPAILTFEAECRLMVGQEPCTASLDFVAITRLLDEGMTQDDVREGIAIGLAKAAPDFRFRFWRNFDGWIRNVAKDRLSIGDRSSAQPRASPGRPNVALQAAQELYTEYATERRH